MRIATSRVAARAVVSLVLCASSVFAQGNAQGPPQFTTIPVQNRMLPTEVTDGHIVYMPPVAGENREAAEERPSGGARPGGGGGGGNVPPDFGLPGAGAVTGACHNSTNNYDATCAFDSYQGEPMLASTGLLLAGAQNDIYPGSCSSSATPGSFGDCGLSVSVSANGQAWSRFKISRNWGGHSYLLDYDPSATVDANGHIFVAFGMSDGGASGQNGIGVVTSADGGATWTKTNPVVLSGGKYFEDKMWITADRTSGQTHSHTNRLYVAWDRNSGNNQLLVVSYSDDGGQTWSPPQKINDGTSSFERVIYAFPAVGPDGTVYVLWHDYARDIIFMDKSTNGTNWGTDVAVASGNIGFGTDIGCNGGRSMAPAPQMAIDAAGSIYVSFAKKVGFGASAVMQAHVTKSTNGGAAWSAPAQVSATTKHQYNPAIAIDSGGRVNVSYLDRRDDANNCLTNTYLSYSDTGGSSFASAVKISDEQSNLDGNPNGPGDYSGIACMGTAAFPYFADHRGSNATYESGTAGSFEIYAGKN